MENLCELKEDIAELETLHKHAKRENVKNIIRLEIRKLSQEIVKIEDESKKQCGGPIAGSSKANSANRYEIKIIHYSWYQTDKTVVFQVPINNVHQLDPSHIVCNFSPKSFVMYVSNMQNKDYSLTITNLYEAVDPEMSKWIVKKDKVVITLKKTTTNEWSHVTRWEKMTSKSGDTDKMDEDSSSNMNDKLMSMMKDMYNRGDDETKRTIAKAWSQSLSMNKSL